MHLLDTNVISEFRKAGAADAGVIAWQKAIVTDLCFISSITMFELERGVLRLEKRDPHQGAVLRAWLDTRVKSEFEGRTLPFDTAAAVACARMHVPDPASERDAMIAAIAQTRGLTVVTRNVRDFAGFGVALINPWDAR